MEQQSFIPIKEQDICRRKHGGAETSIEADKVVQKSQDRSLILGYIKKAGSFGHTLDELSILLDRPPNALSGRLTELRLNGDIVTSDITRPTRTGCKARVYVVI
jgi:hypothetical protein